jgi:protein SCO1/2
VSSDRSNAPSVRRFLLFAALASLPVAAVGWRSLQADPPQSTAAETGSLPRLGRLVEFELTERSGQPITKRDLRGCIWVADFIFTSCAGPCPRMTAAMARLQAALVDLPDVRLVSFSVDPERDTPRVLRQYADRYRADPQRWLFLTGDFAVIRKVAVEGFKLGSVDDPILHSTRFAVVDGEGVIRGYYDSEEADVIDRLAADIRTLGRHGRR